MEMGDHRGGGGGLWRWEIIEGGGCGDGGS